MAGIAAQRAQTAASNVRSQARKWAGSRRGARLFVPPQYWRPGTPFPLFSTKRGRLRRQRRRNGNRANQGSGTKRVITAPPVRLNVTTTRSQPVKRVIDTEQMCEMTYSGIGFQTQGLFTFTANNALLPRLASTAKGYTKYRINSLKFTYLPTVGSSANGTLFMMHLPNLDDDSYREDLDPQDFTPVRSAVRSAISQCCDLVVSGEMMIKQTNGFFVNSDDDQASTNRLFYFPGVFHWLIRDLNTDTVTGNSIGRIDCTYDLTLSEPKQLSLYQTPTFDVRTAHFPSSYGFRSSLGVVSFVNPRGFGVLLRSSDTSPAKLVVDGNSVDPVFTYYISQAGVKKCVSGYLLGGDWIRHTIAAFGFERGLLFDKGRWSEFCST